MAALRIALYARVSTADKGQDPETQLRLLREQASAVGGVGWRFGTEEFVDHASAGDLRGRRAWRALLELADRHGVDVILVFRMDRAFRDVAQAAETLKRLRAARVGLRSITEPWLDTTSPVGESLFYMAAAFAQLEKASMVERIKAGMARARAQGKPLGRRPRTWRVQEHRLWPKIVAGVRDGTLTRRLGARALKVRYDDFVAALDAEAR